MPANGSRGASSDRESCLFLRSTSVSAARPLRHIFHLHNRGLFPQAHLLGVLGESPAPRFTENAVSAVPTRSRALKTISRAPKRLQFSVRPSAHKSWHNRDASIGLAIDDRRRRCIDRRETAEFSRRELLPRSSPSTKMKVTFILRGPYGARSSRVYRTRRNRASRIWFYLCATRTIRSAEFSGLLRASDYVYVYYLCY